MNSIDRQQPAFLAKPLSDQTTRQTAELALAATLVAASPAFFDLGREAAALGLCALVLLPLLIVWLGTRRLLISNPIAVVGLMWIFSAALPPLLPEVYQDPVWYTLSPTSYDSAVLWMYRGWAACVVAYWVIWLLGPDLRTNARNISGSGNENRLRWLVGVAGLTGSVGTTILSRGQGYTFIDTENSASSFDMVFHELKQFAVIYIFLHFHARGYGRLPSSERLLLMSVLAAQALIIISAGSKGAIFEMMAAWLIGSAASAVRDGLAKTFAIGVATLTAVMFTFNVVAQFRMEMHYRGASAGKTYSAALLDQIDAMGEAVGSTVTGKSDTGIGDALDRFGYVSALATLFERSGGESPYENSAASLAAPILAFIPRDLVGEKVQFFNSGEFARMLGWEFGGFSVTLPGSLFWAWGYEGIIVGMLMLGVLLAGLARGSDLGGVVGLVYRAILFRQVMMMLDVGLEFQAILISMTRTLMFLVIFALAGRYVLGLWRNAWPPN